MAFTDEELAVLADLAYKSIMLKEEKGGRQRRSLYDVLCGHEAELRAKLGPGFKDTIDGLMEKTKNQKYEIIKSECNEKGSGFQAFAVADPDNNVTVACRGTECVKDALTDLELGLLVEADQHLDMEKFVHELEHYGYDGFYFTGHSLGGNLAMHGAVVLSDPEKLKGVSVFNAPGFNETYWLSHIKQIGAVHNRIVAYQNEGDAVSMLLTTPGVKVCVESNLGDKVKPIKNHSIGSFSMKDGQFEKRSQTWFREVVENIKPVMVYDIKDRLFCSPIVYNMVQIFGWKWVKEHALKKDAVLRDFSEETKIALLDAVKEVDEEKWWNPVRWDCWYRVERFFGGLNMDSYCNEMNTYYRKLIDVNDASKDQIENIFEQAYQADTEYADKLRESSQEVASVRSRVQSLCDSFSVK